MSDTQEKQGGPGAPRKFDEPLVKKTISLPVSAWRYLLILGDGKLSPGVLEAAEFHQHINVDTQMTAVGDGAEGLAA